MEQYNMRANFFPAREPINGFIGSANLAISNVIRLNGIAVFEKESGGHHIQFPGFGENGSYVVPNSKEAFAQILDVIEKAVADNEKHFGHVAGKMKVPLSVSGKAVNEPYADGRYSLAVGDICNVYGITTQVVPYEKEGKESSFVAVRVPNLPPYEKDGEKVFPPVFKGLKSHYEVDGKEKETDYAQLIQAMVISERKKILSKPPLENQMDTAAQKAAHAEPGKDAPAQEPQR